MALPKINSSPIYEMTIPSMSKKVKFRPYLVKEEKVLMLAFESGDIKQSLQAVVNTIASCIEDTANINIQRLTTFDVEFMFAKIRSKSVGEKSKVLSKCKQCDESNEVTINLEDLSLEVPKNSNIIELTKDIKAELKYPSYLSILEKDIENLDKNVTAGLQIVQDSIEAILTNEERIVMAEEPKENVKEFIESLTSTQFNKITDFLNSMPRLSHKQSFVCKSCSHENTLVVEGINNFF